MVWRYYMHAILFGLLTIIVNGDKALSTCHGQNFGCWERTSKLKSQRVTLSYQDHLAVYGDSYYKYDMAVNVVFQTTKEYDRYSGQLPNLALQSKDPSLIHCIPDTKIAKQVYNELDKLHQCGVKTWVTKARELAEQYEVDISSKIHNLKKYCKIMISNCYKHRWLWEDTNLSRNPILRTYSMFKTELCFDKYLGAITDCRYWSAMTKLRPSSHTLEIERGRYTKPKTDNSERLCPLCNAVEDEIHFLANCKLYEAERLRFLSKLMTKIRHFNELDDVEKSILLMTSEDNQIVTWTGKFIYKSFNIRSRFYLNCGGT